MSKRIETLEGLVKLMLKNQHPDLDEETVKNMMGFVLGNENSPVAPRSSAIILFYANYLFHLFPFYFEQLILEFHYLSN